MEAKPTADMALRYKGLVVGVKTAHYSGPEWTPVERAVEAGTLANIPVMVDFGANRPARSTVAVAALPRGARVEIDAVAVLPS